MPVIAPDLAPEVPGYALAELLGRGALGTVWAATRLRRRPPGRGQGRVGGRRRGGARAGSRARRAGPRRRRRPRGVPRGGRPRRRPAGRRARARPAGRRLPRASRAGPGSPERGGVGDGPGSGRASPGRAARPGGGARRRDAGQRAARPVRSAVPRRPGGCPTCWRGIRPVWILLGHTGFRCARSDRAAVSPPPPATCMPWGRWRGGASPVRCPSPGRCAVRWRRSPPDCPTAWSEVTDAGAAG